MFQVGQKKCLWLKELKILLCGHFPKLEYLEANVEFELDLINYATKEDLKNATGVDALDFAENIDLPHLKSDVDN